MFFPGDQPAALERLLEQHRALSAALQPLWLSLPAETLEIMPGNDCTPLLPFGGAVHLLRGQVDVMLEGRTAFVWQAGDVLCAPRMAGIEPLAFLSEEQVCLRILSESTLERHLDQPPHASTFRRLLQCQQLILMTAHAHANRQGNRPAAGFLRLPAGTHLVQQGTAADLVYTLMRGEARVDVDGIPIGVVREGEIFGALAALTGQPRNADVFAVTDVTLMTVPAEQFVELVRFQPDTFMRLLETLARQIDELNRQLVGRQLAERPVRPALRLVDALASQEPPP